MRNLHCDPNTLAGPVDQRVVTKLGRRFPLDTNYLACMESCHGGVPQIGAVELGSRRYEIAFFLTLLDEESDLPGSFRPHFDDPSMDGRVVNSISYLQGYEHATSRALFGHLVPLAATQAGMCLDRAYVDLFCFDYRHRRDSPSIVLWNAHSANEAYMEWKELPLEEAFDEHEDFHHVPWDKFVLPVADRFVAFVKLLQPNP